MTIARGPADRHHEADPAPRRAGLDETVGPDDASGAPEDASVQDWIEADKARPTLPDETADGLDDMDEEIRHQAEDLPLDTSGRHE